MKYIIVITLTVVIVCGANSNREYDYVTPFENRSLVGLNSQRLRSVEAGSGGKYNHLNLIDHQGQGPIVFPDFTFNQDATKDITPRPSNRKILHPPLNILKALAMEQDLSLLVGKYVNNARLLGNKNTGELMLVSQEGVPLRDVRGEIIVVPGVSPMIATKVFKITPPGEEGVYNSNPRTTPKMDFKTNVNFNPAVNGRTAGVRQEVSEKKEYSTAVCRPEEQTVEVPITVDPHIIHIPTCIRIQRCGGCCGSTLLACEPTQITTVNVTVQKYAYVAELEKINFLRQEYVFVEKHLACGCKCRVKKEHCSSRHIYDEAKCACLCENVQEQDSCLENPLKIWEQSSCSCPCREIRDCSSGQLFDLKTCQCAPIPPKRRGKRNEHNNYRQKIQ